MATKVKDEPMSPTPEQMARGRYEVGDVLDKQANGKTLTIGKAFRRRAMIDVLADQGFFSDREHKALHNYRHHADVVNRSEVRDSLNRERYGSSGSGPTAAMLTAADIVSRCERAAGSLCDILRAVVVDDLSLSEWAMQRDGARDVCRDRAGKRVCTLEPRRKALDIAKLEIKMAAKRVEAEIAA